MRRTSGFTLIELVIVMIVISAALLGMMATMGNATRSLSTNETLQQAAQYAQECAEKVIATRRDEGFTSTNLNTNICSTANLPAMAAGFTRTVTFQDVSGTGSGTDPCPSGTNNCKNITVTVTNGALSSNIHVLLVTY